MRKLKGFAVYYRDEWGKLWCSHPKRPCDSDKPDRFTFTTKMAAAEYKAWRVRDNEDSSASNFHIVAIYTKPTETWEDRSIPFTITEKS